MGFSSAMLETEPRGDALLVRFLVSAIVNQREADAVVSEVRRAALESGSSRVVLNFKGVKHVASVMLGKLLSLRKSLAERGASLVLCGVDPPLRELLKVSGFLKLLPVAPDEERALEA